MIGILPHGLWGREINRDGLTELHTVDTMHERKALMADRADAFIALPGGIGTLEEFAEILTWAQRGVHAPLTFRDGTVAALLAPRRPRRPPRPVRGLCAADWQQVARPGADVGGGVSGR